MTRSAKQNRGYVLVMTLGVLMLAATALVSTGRVAVAHSARARDAQRELQRRAGVASIRNAILPQAERILQIQETARKQPLVAHRSAVRLGDFTFDVILSDEQAKANLNSLLQGASPKAVQSRLLTQLAGTGILGSIHLRPIRTNEQLVITGWGGVFDSLDPPSILRHSQLITCWGTGAINVRRASEPAMRLARCPPWTPLDVSRLIEARQEMFSSKPSPLGLTRAEPPPSRDPLIQLLNHAQIRTGPSGLTLRSDCHSLWIISRDQRREWYDLAVQDASDSSGVRVHTFSW